MFGWLCRWTSEVESYGKWFLAKRKASRDSLHLPIAQWESHVYKRISKCSSARIHHEKFLHWVWKRFSRPPPWVRTSFMNFCLVGLPNEEHVYIFGGLVMSFIESFNSGLRCGAVCVGQWMLPCCAGLSHVWFWETPKDWSPPGSPSMEFARHASTLEQAAISCSRGIFPTQGSNPSLRYLLHWQVILLLLWHLGNPGLEYAIINGMDLEMNREHSVVFETASKYCILDSCWPWWLLHFF